MDDELIPIGSRCVFTLAPNLYAIGHDSGEECIVVNHALAGTYWVRFADGSQHCVSGTELTHVPLMPRASA